MELNEKSRKHQDSYQSVREAPVVRELRDPNSRRNRHNMYSVAKQLTHAFRYVVLGLLLLSCVILTGYSRDIHTLIRDLGREYSSRSAHSALGEIGAPAVEPLVAALKDADLSHKYRIKKVLEDIGSAAVEPLIVSLQNSDPDVRKAVVSVLGKIGDARAVIPLIELLKDRDFNVRGPAIFGLGEIGDQRAVEPLIEAGVNLLGGCCGTTPEHIRLLAERVGSG